MIDTSESLVQKEAEILKEKIQSLSRQVQKEPPIVPITEDWIVNFERDSQMLFEDF